MKLRWVVGVVLLMVCFMPAFAACAAEAREGQFLDFINNTGDGSDFPQAISINNQCDYKACATEQCGQDLFNKTVFEQEIRYVENQFGVRGKDWDLIGQDSVEIYADGADRSYDDLGIQIVATGEKKVLHFDVTGPISAFYGWKYSKGI